jgi:tRNA pseudouridine55 synthase
MISIEQLAAGIVLPIDKPRQWTSFQVVNKVKSVLRHRYGLNSKLKTENSTIKIGHAGTLDPLATGLLLVCIGKATKQIPLLQDGDKVYTGTFVLGATTPCYDLERPIDHYYPFRHITREMADEATAAFHGTIMQTPPLFSAVKVEGQRAYELARAEVEAAVRPKPVTIHSFAITDFRQGNGNEPTPLVSDTSNLGLHLYDSPMGEVPPELPQADFRIACGKGTYIRSIARDYGEALHSGAFLSALRREQIGTYILADAIPLDKVEEYLQ